jgi:hypothetical protein
VQIWNKKNFYSTGRRPALAGKKDVKSMKKIITILGLFILTFTFLGCRQHIDINDYIDKKLPLELKVGNQLKRPDTIKVNSDKYIKLVDWGKANKEGWESTLVSYIADIYVGQGNFRLLYSPGKEGVVIGFTDNLGNPKLFSKRIKKGELDFLKEKE